jgi:hypothetical protein
MDITLIFTMVWSGLTCQAKNINTYNAFKKLLYASVSLIEPTSKGQILDFHTRHEADFFTSLMVDLLRLPGLYSCLNHNGVP